MDLDTITRNAVLAPIVRLTSCSSPIYEVHFISFLFVGNGLHEQTVLCNVLFVALKHMTAWQMERRCPYSID
jgi:hypothetical protein